MSTRSQGPKDQLTRAPIFAHCPECGKARRVFTADPEAEDLFITCNCAIMLPSCEPCKYEVDVRPQAVGCAGGLTRASVSAYLGRLLLWRQARRLGEALLSAGIRPVPTLCTLAQAVAKTPTAGEVLFMRPPTCLHPGLEEWVALAERILLASLACDTMSECQ